MPQANTPVPEKKEETTPPEGTDTLADDAKGGSTPPSSEDKKVAELEDTVEGLQNKLEKQEAIAKTAQKKERIETVERLRVEKTLEKIKSGEISADEVEEEENIGETSAEKEIRLKAKSEIMGLVLDNPEYQKLLAKDSTLKQVIRNNPFALISDYLDSEDAVEQIKDVLDKGVLTLKAEKAQSQPKGEPKEGEGKEFESGAVQPSSDEGGSPAEESPAGESGVDKVEESIRSKIRVKTS